MGCAVDFVTVEAILNPTLIPVNDSLLIIIQTGTDDHDLVMLDLDADQQLLQLASTATTSGRPAPMTMPGRARSKRRSATAAAGQRRPPTAVRCAGEILVHACARAARTAPMITSDSTVVISTVG